MRSAAMQALTNDYTSRYPGVTVYGIGDQAHQLHPSDHNEDDTPGSKAAQSDSDNKPEHRAIDVMLGPAFNRDQAYQTIGEVLADPDDLARLAYINFENYQWARSNGWVRHDNSDDPHPDHIHFSGWAPEDDNGAPFLEGDDMSEWSQPDPWGKDPDGHNRQPAQKQRDHHAALYFGSRPLNTQGQPVGPEPWIVTQINSLNGKLDQVLAALAGGASVPGGLSEAALDAVEKRVREVQTDALEGGAAAVRADA